VGVAPYPVLEPFYFSPMKVIEYMAAGLPVVASSVGQLVDLIDDGQTGLLVRPEDPLALAAALEKLACDRSMRSRLGRKAQRRALSRHTWQGVAHRVENTFSQLVAKAMSSSSTEPRIDVVGSSGGAQ
jgi:glycosyltransferase involved in cell wall biosynthesis